MKRIICTAILCLSLLVFLSGYALALPSAPPPPGKYWVEIGGEWILVVAPPGDGPYIWRNGKWLIDPANPPHGSEWIPGHWSANGWVSGHWKVVPSPGEGTNWVPGHWRGNRWIPGHWAGSPTPGKHWVPGHRGQGGRWIPGHWVK
ncbi:MAG: hypothetical protein A2Y97_09180 [Nitrospirae bacterium RBG_13_39_12]|nr:MAG: hypothetical protein A2Y97_09180 [Nitrospirae bacterium RBG_13_39_12]